MWWNYPPGNKTSWRLCDDACLYLPATSQVRLKWNTLRRLNGRRQVASVVRLHDVLLECRGDLSRGRNNDVSSERLHDVLNKS